MNREDELYARIKDDLAWGSVTPRRCRRHEWVTQVTFDEPYTSCVRCGKLKDEAASRRAVNNRKRGNAFERTVAKAYGGQRRGQLGGLDDVVVGKVFAVQTKKLATAPSLNAIKQILKAMDGIPERVPLFVYAEPGKDREAVVVLWLRDHAALHGSDGVGEDA